MTQSKTKMFAPKISVIIFMFPLLASTSGQENSTDVPENKTSTPITSDEYLDGLFYAYQFEGEWVTGSDNLIRLKTDNTVEFYDILTGEYKTIFELQEVIDEWDISPKNVMFSKDETLALVQGTPDTKNWKPVLCIQYLVCEVSTSRCSDLVQFLENSDQNPIPDCVQLGLWAPEKHGLAFVASNNLYYIDNARNISAIVRQLTFDGCEENGIYNGVSNWIKGYFGDYPEKDIVSFWFSTNGTYLTFWKHDESQVEETQWPSYGYGTEQTQYRKVKYVKAGAIPTKSELFVIDLTHTQSKPRKLKFVETAESTLQLNNSPYWITDTKFILLTSNREHTSLAVHVCFATSAVCKQAYSDSVDYGYTDCGNFDVSSDKKRYYMVQPLKEENDTWSYNRIALRKFKNPRETVLLTGGNMSVISVMKWDSENQIIYFMGTFWNGTVADPSEKHLYSVSEDGSKLAHCITCELKNSDGELCRSNDVKISANFTYFIHSCNGPGIPETTTRYLNKAYNSVEHPGPTLVNNSQLRQNLRYKLRPIVKEFLVPVDGGFMARARLLIPRNYNATQKYPLLVSVYAGPGSQSINQAYLMTWEESFVSDKNVIVAYIDGRGSRGQSVEQIFSVHRKVGTVEIEDQIAVTKWLIENEAMIDGNKTSIMGWSYGGFATIKALQTDTDNVFKCGIAGAPVTKWEQNYNGYTEWVLGLPDDNPEGYRNADVTRDDQVVNLKNKEFLLVHGTADTRVPYKHSMLLARNLQENGVLFHQLTYPDEGHSFRWALDCHFYKSIERFLLRTCYQQAEA